MDDWPEALGRALAQKRYGGALVDLGIDSHVAIQLCEMLSEYPAVIPVIGVLCCVSQRTGPTLEALASKGVRSFIDLHANQSSIIQAVMAASRGQSVIQLESSAMLAHESVSFLGGGRDSTAPPSCREREVLALLAEGMTREQIARTKSLSLRTVMRTISCLEEKLDAPCSFVLVRVSTPVSVLRRRIVAD